MKTVINIGTNRGNLVNVTFDKPFQEIKYDDVYDKAREKYPEGLILIHGWVDVTKPTGDQQ